MSVLLFQNIAVLSSRWNYHGHRDHCDHDDNSDDDDDDDDDDDYDYDGDGDDDGDDGGKAAYFSQTASEPRWVRTMVIMASMDNMVNMVIMVKEATMVMAGQTAFCFVK